MQIQDEAPSYEALSYVWGSANQPSYANVSTSQRSGVISITRNLDVALRHLRYKKKPWYLWVDALCINQANIKEKDIQVTKMGTIFATADSVIAWLGPKENNSDEAMTWFQIIGRKLDADWETLTMRPRLSDATKELAVQQERENLETFEYIKEFGEAPWTIEQARSVYFILIRPFFERAWIVQEIRLARRVLFQCGTRTLSEDDFWTAVMSLQRSPRVNAGIVCSKAWFEACQRAWYLAVGRNRVKQESIDSLRGNLGHLICNDPRDKIYSALGLMDPRTQSLQIVPSYTQATEKVYMDIAQRVVTHLSSLDILEQCELSSRHLDIPSWVPDWSTPMKSGTLHTTWSACAYVASRASFDINGLHCTVSGISIGRITEVRDRSKPLHEATISEWIEFTRSWRPALESLNDTYVTGEELTEVYCRVLIANQFSSILHSGAFPEFSYSFKSLNMVWSDDESEEEIKKGLCKSNSYIRKMSAVMCNRVLFKTIGGHLGLAPLGTQAGDVLCVLLGCHLPIILRPTVDDTYEVVGHCYAHGLMNGEAIYRNTHTAKEQFERSGHDPYYESFSPDLEDLDADPIEMLERVGAKVESVQEYPYQLFVRPEALRDAGIPVEDFVLA